jgi:hypothetical protein
MEIEDFKTFLHSDVLALFTSLNKRAEFTTQSDLAIGSKSFTVPNGTTICIGDKVNIGNSESFTVVQYDPVLLIVTLSDATKNAYPAKTSIVVLYDNMNTLTNSLQLAKNEAYSFSQSLSKSGMQVRYDAETYTLKSALIHVYNWILQNKANMKNMSLTGLSLSNSDIFEHFLKLRDAEKQEIEDMRNEAYNEMLSSNSNARGTLGGGMKLNFVPVRRYNGRYR